MNDRPELCAVVPAYRATQQVASVVAGLMRYVAHVFVVDDHCPDGSGDAVDAAFGASHPRVTVLRLPRNLGVGGAVMEGYRAAAAAGFRIIIKVDADGQMDPAFIPALAAPIEDGLADYTKGNRFFDPELLRTMPRARLIGNAGLSFLAKLSTGHWQVMDPTNGFTAIHADLLPWLHLERVEQRYFFETDLLFRLGIINAVVQDVPMPARYGDEQSHLRIGQALFEFSGKHLMRLFKRIFYTYFLRGFNLGSVCLLMALPLLLFSLVFGLSEWHRSVSTGIPATAGSIMLAAMPGLIGIQLLLAFFGQDMARTPAIPLHRLLHGRRGESSPALVAAPTPTETPGSPRSSAAAPPGTDPER